jgi:hypothetical protein
MILTIGSFVGTLNRETNYETAYARAEKYDLEIANLLPEKERETYKKRVHQIYEKAKTRKRI